MTRRLKISSSDALQALLKEELHNSLESRFLHRVHCVLLIGAGHSCYEIANCFGETPRTLERWVRQFESQGISGLKDDQKPGRPKKLNTDQLKHITHDIYNPPSKFAYSKMGWDGKLLATHLKNRFGITLSVRQCQRLLKQLRQTNTSNT